MKEKVKIDIGDATSKLIILCWITIFVCNILKFFGYKEFEIPMFNTNINIWLQRLINLFLYDSNSIMFLLLLQRKVELAKLYIDT